MLYVPVVPTVMKTGEPVKAYEPIEKSLPLAPAAIAAPTRPISPCLARRLRSDGYVQRVEFRHAPNAGALVALPKVRREDRFAFDGRDARSYVVQAGRPETRVEFLHIELYVGKIVQKRRDAREGVYRRHRRRRVGD